MNGLSKERLGSVKCHTNDMIDNSCSLSITGRTGNGRAQLVAIPYGKVGNGTGIGAECEHCGGTKGHAKQREFVRWNYIYFHRIFRLCQKEEQALCQKRIPYRKCCKA